MRRASRLLVLLVVATMLVLALRPPGRVRSATAEPALWVDGANAACSDAQARVLDPTRPYCSVARAAAVVAAGDPGRLPPRRYAGRGRPAPGRPPPRPGPLVARAARA